MTSAGFPACTSVTLLPHAWQDERTAKLARMQQLEAELQAAQKELAQYADNDPQKVDAMSAPPLHQQGLCVSTLMPFLSVVDLDACLDGCRGSNNCCQDGCK
jgi:hypothetical protein